MFYNPNKTFSTMSPYAYFFTAVDLAARADAHAERHDPGEDQPAKHKLPNTKALLHWASDFAASAVLAFSAVLLSRKRMT